MSLLYPDLMVRRITDITPRRLRAWGIKALILDVDNTLTTHNNPRPDTKVLAWLEEMKRAGVHLVILSNNREERVKMFARALRLDYTANACKPLTKGFRETARRLRLPSRQIAAVGDQIFTDILGGNLFGSRTILVEPMEPETGPFFRLKRKLEKGILRRYRHARAG